MKNKTFSYLRASLIALYFAILFAERAQSLVRVIIGGLFFRSGFDGWVNVLTAASLSATLLALLLFPAYVRRPSGDPEARSLSYVSIVCGVLLLSGMVHTEYTIPVVQFVSYGALILAMALHTAIKGKGAPARKWYSFAYLVVFSMAIPVMYPSGIQNAVFFHILEAVTVIVLVFFFTLKTRLVFLGKGEDLLMPLPFALMVILVASLTVLRFEEEVNVFALVFAAIAVVMFFAGKILFAKLK